MGVPQFSNEIGYPRDTRYETHKGVLQSDEAYDTGGLDMHSKATHDKWIASLPLPVVRIEHGGTIRKNLKTVLTKSLPNKADADDTDKLRA